MKWPRPRPVVVTLMAITLSFSSLSLAKPAKPRSKSSHVESLDDIKLDGDARDDLRATKRETKKRTPAAASTSPAVDANVEAAIALEKKKDFRGMLSLLASKEAVLSRRGLLALARAHGALNDSASQVKVLQLCLAKNPRDYVVQTLLGDAYGKAKKSAEAVEAYQVARAMNANFAPAYEGLWNELERANNYYEARAVLNDMVKKFGAQPRLFTALCRLYSIDNYLEKATEVCRAAIERDPQRPENYVELGRSLRDQEGAAEAEKVLEGAAKRFPASEPVQSTAGELRLDKKDYVSAYRFFQSAVKADPKSARAWQGLGNTAFELRKNEEALDAFVRGCEIDRKLVREMRIAIGKLRTRHDTEWVTRFEDRLTKCE